ncbi:MAG: electron transfer flavoprotein subunit alpha/FixB family protein [Clostridiales Family XIII bacterium]|jgi:electron transfer flavoprotein alpha subunit|nr:electron transfer flavoprotein subunit alpha/FixB family protein [Clostridiales Family XIII bacterium]
MRMKSDSRFSANDGEKIKKILILAETEEGKLRRSFSELLAKAKAILPEAVCGAVYIGAENPAVLGALRTSGIDALYAAEDARLAVFHPEWHCALLELAIRAFDPDLLLICATAAGEELAPAMGVRFHTGVAAHCLDISVGEDGETVQMVPAFGGKVIGEICIPATRPRIVTVKEGIFSFENRPRAREDCALVMLDTRMLRDLDASIEVIDATFDEHDGPAVEGADFVVCGGYGLRDKASFDTLKELAEHFSGALGYTRPALDSGLADDASNMIGTSGKAVRPKVYIGFGVSGASHHVCGIKNAGTVISVNNDPLAPIFDTSDFYAVGDAPKIAEALLALVKSGS